MRRIQLIRLAKLACLAPTCAFVLNGCFAPDRVLTAAANTFALTAASSAQGFLTSAISTLLSGG